MKQRAPWTLVVGLALATSAFAQAGGPPVKGAALVIEDFESYASDAALAKAWYKPPHGNWMRQTLAVRPGGTGGHALKLEHRTEPGDGKFYAAICIVKSWNLAGFDAVRFWLKPDGSGRELTIQFNIADAKGDNVHDLWQASYRPEKGDTTARLVTIPFARLERPGWLDRAGKRASFEPAFVNELALYVGAPDGPFGQGSYELDDFEAVRVHDDLALRALAAMKARAETLKIEGVAVVAWTEGDAVRSWSSRMAVVGTMTKPPAGNDAGANLLGIAYAKASEMAATLVNSGTAARKPLTGEFGWQGGVVRKGEAGLLIAAFSGGPSEDDVKVSRAGLDVLAGGRSSE
jgi:hypothetical protein